MDEEDRLIAIDLAAGLRWLGRTGRDGGRLLAEYLTGNDDAVLLDEAIDWICSIKDGEKL